MDAAMNAGDRIHGFLVERIKELPELEAVLYQLIHPGTGFRLVWLKRPDENKTFGIAFPTPPWNDTGVFHILEHSVLCGSRRYPVKEPFVELMTGAMNTFLNAMTFPDKTFYPVSSRNGKDFFNLMRVYLDAVFYPAIYQKPEIFRQEGWHYEFDEAGEPSYQGVVLNEMKGAFAGADQQMYSAMTRALFPDTPYRYVSGGDPSAIPDLTYEEFLDSHRRFYAPSNAYVYLDGDLDIDAALKLLDDEYLAGWSRAKAPIQPAASSASPCFPVFQKPVDAGVTRSFYEISPSEEEKGRVRLAWGWVVGSYADREKLTAMQILADVLCGSNQSLLSQTILSQGLAQDLSLQVQDSGAQPWVQLEVRNLDEENIEPVRSAVFDRLKQLAQDGIEPAKLLASLTNLEFQMRQRDYGSYPQGLIFGMQVLDSWLYGGQPEAKLEVILLASHQAGELRRQAEAERLRAERSSWSGEQRRRLMDEARSLSSWQKETDSPEKLALLPRLGRSDIPDRPEAFDTQEFLFHGIPTLLHREPTGGIYYISLYFDANGLAPEELSQLSFLCRLLGKLPAGNLSAGQLDDRIRLLCGSLSFSPLIYEEMNSAGLPGGGCRIKLAVSFSALESQAADALRLAAEILRQTSFADGKAVLDILRQTRQQLFQRFLMAGSGATLSRLSAQISAAGAAGEYTGGLLFYQWLTRQEKAFDWDSLCGSLSGLLRRLAQADRLILSVTGGGTGKDRAGDGGHAGDGSHTGDGGRASAFAAEAAERLRELLHGRAGGNGTAASLAYCTGADGTAHPDRPCAAPVSAHTLLKPLGIRREGILIPADIAFAARGGSLASLQESYSGQYSLAAKILSLDYLWNEIRVQGGAYGAGLAAEENGFIGCYSYRDPDAARSLSLFAGCGQYLEDFCARLLAAEGNQDDSLTSYMIGAVSDASPLLTPRMRGMQADLLYLKGISPEQRIRRRRELLDATPESLRLLAAPLTEILSGEGICVVGGAKALKTCRLDFVETV